MGEGLSATSTTGRKVIDIRNHSRRFSSSLIELHSPWEPQLTLEVRRIADCWGVPEWPLRLQALIHLPRITKGGGSVLQATLNCEIERVAKFVPPMKEWRQPEERMDLRRSEENRRWIICEVEEPVAQDIMERFHYLRSHRTESRHYGLWIEGCGESPIVMATVSDNDVPLLCKLSEMQGVIASQSCVVSRVFAFPSSPRNSVSVLLSRIAHQERCRSRILFTYVNPNLGFTGISYRASSWEKLGEEPISPYSYVDEEYITDRVLRTRFDTTDLLELRSRLGTRFSQSKMQLKPLLVFGRLL